MNKKSDTNPARSLHRSHRLGAYLMIFAAAVQLIPSKNWLDDEPLFALLFTLAYGAVVLTLLIKMIFVGKDLSASQKRFYESGDYLDEAMIKGIKYSWVSILLFLCLLMALAATTNFLLSSWTIMRLSMAIIIGIPSIVFLLLTRDFGGKEV